MLLTERMQRVGRVLSVFFFKAKTAYGDLSGLVGSEKCIRGRQRAGAGMGPPLSRMKFKVRGWAAPPPTPI